MLELNRVGYRVADKPLLSDVTFRVRKAECFGVIGPNGSGKTTLIKLITGMLPLAAGEIALNGKNVKDYSRKQMARLFAVLSQEAMPPYPIPVYDAVLMGRFPHLGLLRKEGKSDHEQVERVLRQTGLTHLRDRHLHALSGGERQRAAIARAMAQEPRVLMLDEPTTYLDIGSQIQILNMVKEWQQECELTVIMVLHDLNLAAQYCDRLALLHEGRLLMIGETAEVIASPLIARVYRTETHVVEHPVTHVPQILLTGKRR